MPSTCCKPTPKRCGNPRQPLVLGFVIAFALVIWYQRQPEHRKEFIKNFVRQIPDLPGRYFA